MSTYHNKTDQKLNGKHCSYNCKYYQDGAVLSLCNKFNEQLKYSDKGKPLPCNQCVIELQVKPACTVYQNIHESYMIGISSPLFSTRKEAEDWAIENGYRINTDY